MIQVNGLNHIVLHVQDVARAKKFYTELLGMTSTGKTMLKHFCTAATRVSPCSKSRVILP
jgi:catechol 2,3-dioxygenase-like lactoylglutathione lyase family enzyme